MTMTPSTTATIHIPTPIGDHGGSRTHDLHVSTCILTAITRFPTLRRDSQSHTGLGSYFPLSVPPQLTVSDQPPSLLRSFLLSYRGQTLPGYLASGRGYPLTAFAFTEPCWSGQRDSNPRPSAPKADALPDCAMPRHCCGTQTLGKERPRRTVPRLAQMVVTPPGQHAQAPQQTQNWPPRQELNLRPPA
jgi:hypothetical protein